MPEGERGAAAATGESSSTLLVGPARSNACSAISVPRAKAAPRRKSVLRYPTLAYQHEQPSHILHGWQPSAPSRSPSGNGYRSPLRPQRNSCGYLTERSHINVRHEGKSKMRSIFDFPSMEGLGVYLRLGVMRVEDGQDVWVIEILLRALWVAWIEKPRFCKLLIGKHRLA